MHSIPLAPLRYCLVAATALALIAPPAPALSAAGPTDELGVEASAGPKKHRRRQARPVMMGTSGGNVNDFTLDLPFISCCSGTLGSLVRKGAQLFILSNNHVLAQANQASVGDDINQPGMLDNKCNAPASDFVAQLTGWKRLKLNRGKNQVDAAIAAVVDGTVDPSGAIIDIGVPGNQTVNPTVGMKVKKGGRTTGVRSGVIDSVNVTVNVQYPEECSEDAAIDTARFVKQIIIVSNSKKSFSAGGDSGSLIVEDVDTCPRQVGLLYAGNDVVTVANKMSTVLKQVKKMRPKGPAELVGCTPVAAGIAEVAVQRGIPELGERQLRLAERIQARSDRAVLSVEGVNAMGIGRSASRPELPVFKVYVDRRRPDLQSRIPRSIEGIAVEVVESGPIRARNCRRVAAAQPSVSR